ncbi:MAG: OmpA family protein [Bacteroidales bacterium]
MNKFVCVIILVFATSNISLGQSSYLKLIEKGKYAKAEKKINKAIVKEPNDVGLNYTMAMLLINRKYKGYNASKSYEYLITSVKIYANLTDEKVIKGLNKIPINTIIFQNYTDTICKYALEDAIAENTVEVYDKYREFYKNAPYSYWTKAIENRDIAAFKIACDRHSVESYQYFISKYPNANQIKRAIENRDIVAFKIALATNSVESYQYFISKNPNANQINEAIAKRNALAYLLVKAEDSIYGYKGFVNKYPAATEVKQAWIRIYELAFAQAEKGGTTNSYKKFIDEYPQSKQYTTAFRLFEEKQFFENTTPGNWESYRLFIENYSNNSWVEIARDSICSIGKVTEDLKNLSYCVKNFSGSQRNEALILLHDIYTNDGETATLDLFYQKYDDDTLEAIKASDYELAEQGNQLLLHLPYNAANYTRYDDYIRLAAPREKAFVALQRLIASDLTEKNWQSAINTIKAYTSFFGKRNKKLIELIKILEYKWDSSIKIQAFGTEINSKEGGEYTPVITADDKSIYFCGRNRKDNIGGEDIYVAQFMTHSPARVVSDLSTAYSHDAPVSVSTDGTTMLLFKNGKLFSSEKTSNGWENAVELSDEINSGLWQADAIVSSDGNALIFSSIRDSNYDYFISVDPKHYHGEVRYASDIYVSLKNENNEWDPPINLGLTINTIYCDRSPFLHPDMKTLYFSSSGHGGLGDLEVLKSTRLNDSCWDCWSEPINMGKEINTDGLDWGYRISTDGEKAYFSKRLTEGNDDIYWLNLPPHLRPDFVATISGKLLDNNNRPVSAEIRWEDLQTGKSVGQSKSDPSDGSFFIVLPLGKIYGYYVDKGEYFPLSNNLDLRNNNKPVVIKSDINMITFKQMIDEGTAVPINNLFFDFGMYKLLPYSIPELKRVAIIIKTNNLKVEIDGHTDNIGDDKSNQFLSEQRANAVKEFLVNEGCDESLFSIIGFGETKPVSSNENESGRSKNRRVELKFVK